MNESTNLVNQGYKLLENRIFNNLSVDVAKDYDLSTSLKTPLMMIQRGADKSNDTDTSEPFVNDVLPLLATNVSGRVISSLAPPITGVPIS